MCLFSLRQFSVSESLQSIQPQHLLALLGRHAEYFRAHGIDVSRFEGAVAEYEALCRILMQPGEDAPRGLIEDLCLVDEMATPDAMDVLWAAARAAGVELDMGAESTPADVAMQVRLAAPRLLEEKHSELFLSMRRRTFEYFRLWGGTDWGFHPPGAERLKSFEEALGARLERLGRGRGCRVRFFNRPDGAWFLVRRGDTCRREGALEADGSTSVSHRRPKKCDVIKYDAAIGELAVGTEGSGGQRVVALYRELFGELLFNDKRSFPDLRKYTLEPLETLGEGALICSDVEGIEHITLSEVQVFHGGAYGGMEIHRAKDVFRALRSRRRGFAGGRIVRASFLVQFTDAKTPRFVTICPSNIASYTRDSDAGAVEGWLIRRGFVESGLEASDAEIVASLGLR